MSKARDPHNPESQGSYSPLAIPCGARGGRFLSAWRSSSTSNPCSLKLFNGSLGELTPGMIRGVFSNEPAEQIPAARQREADRDPSVDVLQFFCLEIPEQRAKC